MTATVLQVAAVRCGRVLMLGGYHRLYRMDLEKDVLTGYPTPQDADAHDTASTCRRLVSPTPAPDGVHRRALHRLRPTAAREQGAARSFITCSREAALRWIAAAEDRSAPAGVTP